MMANQKELLVAAQETEQESPSAVPTTKTVSEVLADIRVDSRLAPSEYLDEVVVPYGGE